MANSSINFVGDAAYLISALKEDYKEERSLEYGCALEDIAQSHYFTMQVSKIKVTYDHPKFGAFLPVKSANFTYVGFDSMSIPVGIYGNLPLMRRKSVGRLSLTLYDNDRDQVEQSIKNWVNECFPRGMYVNYLSNMWAELVYTSYTTKGVKNNTLRYMVIPADNYQVSRDYESNGAKLINLGLIVIGESSRMTAVENIERTEVPESKADIKAEVTRDTVNPAQAAIGKNTYSWEKQGRIDFTLGESKAIKDKKNFGKALLNL